MSHLSNYYGFDEPRITLEQLAQEEESCEYCQQGDGEEHRPYPIDKHSLLSRGTWFSWYHPHIALVMILLIMVEILVFIAFIVWHQYHLPAPQTIFFRGGQSYPVTAYPFATPPAPMTPHQRAALLP